ncbi:MAG: hypothetical protein BWY10_00743 [Chloroflexi bacterium ADurb.Bin180]|nr:MAG: hypothetical protein BWY10_00743 [Chloroflexi bacterium ADurb.Bin180]
MDERRCRSFGRGAAARRLASGETLLIAAVLFLACFAAGFTPVAADGPWRRPLVKLSGPVELLHPNQWWVDGLPLRIDPATAPAAATVRGAEALVVASVDDGGLLAARSVALRPDAGELGSTVEFRCVIDELEPKYWIVCNRIILVTERTVVEGRPEVGYLATVKAVRLSRDSLLARSIKVSYPDAYAEVEFEGPIQGLGAESWTVNDITVLISPVTEIRGTPQVGQTSQVKGVLQPSGAVLALVIVVKGAGSGSQVDLEGLVESIASDQWVVGGVTVAIGPQTFIDESRAPAEVGAKAQVRALRLQSGSLLALRIRLLRPD